MKKEEFCNFIGIDISKKTLDAVFIFNKEIDKSSHQQFSKDDAGIKKLMSFVKKQKGVAALNSSWFGFAIQIVII